MLAECRVTGQWPTIEAMALVRLLVSQTTGWAAQMTDDEYVSELARNDLRDALMMTGAGAALAQRGRQKRTWLDAFDRSTLVPGDPSDAIEWFRSLFNNRAAKPEEALARRLG